MKTYVIEQRGAQWCLLTSDKSRVLGCHDTKADAEAQERAVQAREQSQDLHAIRGVEVFKSGTWNGDPYTDADLDAMAAASREVGFTPPLKLGHEDRGGKPAIGWVENLRRVGSALVADLVSLPKTVYEAIRTRAFDRVSAEIYWDLERNGKTYPRALKALALLGAEIPAVDLAPLSAFLSMPPWPAPPARAFAAYAVELGMSQVEREKHMAEHDADKDKEIERLKARIAELEGMMKDKSTAQSEQLAAQLKAAEQQIAALTEARRQERMKAKTDAVKIPAFRPAFQALYDLATSGEVAAKKYAIGDKKDLGAEAVVDTLAGEINTKAAKLFLEVSMHSDNGSQLDDPRAEVDRRVKEYIEKHKFDAMKDYKKAFDAVLAADADLKTAYAGS